MLIESHERTIVRRTRRTSGARAGQALTVAPEGVAEKARDRLSAWWRAVAQRLIGTKRSRP
ncbi:MAG: hypothetical protein ACJ741_16305 [Pyrinomonadaceae bacterium]